MIAINSAKQRWIRGQFITGLQLRDQVMNK